MKKFFLVTLILMLHTLLFADIACDSNDECPDGMYCSPEEVCSLDPATKATYAEVSVALGEKSPGLHIDALYLSPADGKQVLGQLNLSVKNPGETKKIYTLFRSLSVKQSRSSLKIALQNLELIHDKNGNGRVDAEDEKWNSEVAEDSTEILFTIDDYFVSLKTNNTYSLLIVGEVTYADAVVPENQMITLKINDKTMIDITAREAVAIVEPDLSFPKIIVIPSGNVLLFNIGGHHPVAPEWADMTGFFPVFHLEMKPIEQDVEWSGFEIKVVGTSAKFGLSLPAVKVFEDRDNDGVGDTLLATLTVEHEGSDFVVFKPQDAPTILKKGIKTSLVVEVDMQLYSGQYAKFTISDVDTNAKVIGGTIVSDVFKYDCTKEDDGCRLAPGDEVEAASGCSVLSIF